MKAWTIVAAAMALMLTGNAHADGNAQAGSQKARMCETCHGKGGYTQTGKFPILAGQHESYLIQALKDYRSGQRKNSIMESMASHLSDQDIQDLAAYFSSQKSRLCPPSAKH